MFARYWEWERLVKANLASVLDEKLLTTVFQTIFELGQERVIPCGYEALARFPLAPGVPVGLWFRIAREEGLRHELESLAAETAADCCHSLPSRRFLTVNSSLISVGVVLEELAPRVDKPVVLDVPYLAALEPTHGEVFAMARDAGVRISLDDVPLDQLHELRTAIQSARPDYVKVDVLIGLFDNPMGRFNLAEAAAWCRESGITLMAERVESSEEFEMLQDLGVELVQGYWLARPS